MSGHDGDSNDALVVPFLWVPDDASEPTEWLMRHPDAVRVPATFEQDTPSISAGQRQEAGSDHPDTMGDGGNTSITGDQSSGSESPASNNSRRRPSAYWLTAAGVGRTDPVEAYRQADEGLPRTNARQPTTPDGAITEPEPDASVEVASENNTATQDAAAHSNDAAPAGIDPHSSAAIPDPADLRRSVPEEPGGFYPSRPLLRSCSEATASSRHSRESGIRAAAAGFPLSAGMTVDSVTSWRALSYLPLGPQHPDRGTQGPRRVVYLGGPVRR